MEPSKVAVLPRASRPSVFPNSRLLHSKTRTPLLPSKTASDGSHLPVQFGVRVPLIAERSCIPSPNALLGA